MKTLRVRKIAAAGVAAGLLAAVLPAGVAAGAAAPVSCAGRATKIMRSGAMETVALGTLHVEAATAKKAYRIGETARFPVTITRPAKEDPLGQGIPIEDRPMTMAADGVNIGVGLLFNDVFLPGFAVTDDEGQTTIKVKIERYVKPGPAQASFYTWKNQADSPCLRVEESGFRAYADFFTVKK
jgi:hypothetical protein